ncbi:MAG: hypothetical protein Q7S69_10530 [Nitrosomonadaceae bacterium]|nr:hypothetical protein [Nitrosomonadaceae bacterium]
MPIENALTIIQANLGKQFHLEWGARFIRLGEEGYLNRIAGHSEPGIPLQQCPICGPTIVISKHHQHGDHVYCRACGGEALVKREGSHLAIETTGRHGTASDLEPEVDNDLLDHLAQEGSKHISISATRSKPFWHWPF